MLTVSPRVRALVATVSLVIAGCSSSVVVADPDVAASSGDGAVAEADDAAGGDADDGETILAPDFELELEPGQDPEDVLGTDAEPGDVEAPDDDPGADGAAAEVPDAIFGLCPTIEAFVTRDGAADLDVILADAPVELHAAIRTLAVDATGAAVADPAPLDAWSDDVCSIPMVAAARQLAGPCPGTDDAAATCVRMLVDDAGGLCFDDETILLSCVSGLPIG